MVAMNEVVSTLCVTHKDHVCVTARSENSINSHALG